MDIGTLTASLQINAASAMASMTSFEKMMFTVVNNIDNQLNKMSATMLKVGASAKLMGNEAVTAAGKIAAASRASDIQLSRIFVAGKGGTTVQPFSTPSVPIIPSVTPVIDSKPAISSLDNLSTSIARTSQRIRTFGYLSSVVLTVPIMMFGKASIKAAEEFEYSMQKIVGLVGVSQKQINDWNKDLLKLGPVLGKSPQELADALYYITSGGRKGAEALDILTLSAKAAEAGLGETRSVADFATSAMNSYRASNLTAAKAIDVLIAATREGKMDATTLGSSMQSVLPIASALKVPIEQVAGAMASMSLQGAKATNAATYLKGILTAIEKIKPSNAAGKALEEMGSSGAKLRDMLGSKGLMPVLLQIQEWTKSNPELLTAVFGNIRNLTGDLSLMGDNLVYNEGVMKRVAEATGSLNKAVEATQDTLKVRMDKALAQVHSSLIVFGEDLGKIIIPILEKLIGKMKEVTDHFDNMSDAQKKLRITALALTAALGPIALVVSLVGYLSGAIIKLVSWLSLAGAWVVRLGGGLLKELGFLMENPFTGGIAALGIIWKELDRYEDKVKAIAKAHDLFQTSLVGVNGEIKKLKDLSQTDVSAMSSKELQSTYSSAVKAYTQAYTTYQNTINNKKGFNFIDNLFGANKPNDALMKEKLGELKALQIVLNEVNIASADSVYAAWQDQVAAGNKKLKKTSEEVTKATEEQRAAADRLAYAWLRAHEKTIEAWGKLDIKQLGINDRFDLRSPIGPNNQPSMKDRYGLPTQNPAFSPSLIGSYGETAKVMNKLSEEIEFVNIKEQSLGITLGKHRELFDSTRARVNAYSKALEDYLAIPVTQRGPSWKAQVDDTIANLEKMQAELDKIQARKDFLNGIRDSFTNLFTSVMSGTESMSNAIKGFANSVLHSFEKLIAEDLANKLMKAIFPQQGTGFFDFLMKMLGIGAPVTTGGLAIPALLPMEGIMGATGGRVPQGYPNDTYPALLTSGETIIPNGLSGLGRQPAYTFEDVKFVIEQDKLVGILKKAGIKNSIY